ncbi:hypothetical protein SHI21_13540 [Bacteriovorax sp. PP10]|uniref:SMODS and SLOG-associating 2TM effector domain-containing protein n=1 Tax=Bacteriovorax antarcticus TaxID=3088717 RepID=A0ABU5VXB2_9BACT|nr:hypothetical protein [Bacteriovorax sp. PP10]MEA9357242.1 hypothetical protein [Bacteriovorax sp. PP10]
MKKIDFNKYKFKLRSLPNSKTASRYLEAVIYFIIIFVIYNFINICLFSDGFMPTLPALLVLALPIGFIHVYSTIETEYKNVKRDTFKEVIVHIRLRQTQSLIEKLEDNPEILNEKYQKKSLLYWAKHYKNIQANSIIIEQMKKPK